ncbi:hypothetical protein BVC80_1289g121 [Macleaya cordata]|uniref:START-like domain n=1 Tax=Macleaya cordata TaxID=56857 RepID=A0A200Q9Q8_MACCD|nr:hypothetical protein BVC80_1289g121 [Macleaya cordata]
MGNKQKIVEYRERLDRTLASHDLSNEESIKSRVKNELLRSSPSEIEGYVENVADKRSKEVSNFLDMLRSVGNDKFEAKTHGAAHGEWKLKQDTDEYRVMYREGPQGTPFHTLLVEGFVDGPLDVCLCLSWEIALFNKWWPQFNFPAFKIIESRCVQKVRIGEQIALVRMKVAWPLSAREVILHYFELEYFEDDLIIVVLNTVSDIESIDRNTHGFTNDGIPEAKDIVRADLVGGFALQKVTSNRSYFRTMATMDVKLDYVPPSLINFMSRQLIGSGFKLYKKAVASVAKGDEDFGKALKDPLYARTREGLNHENRLKKDLEPESLESKKSLDIRPEEPATETLRADTSVIDQTSLGDHCGIQTPQADKSGIGQTSLSEIEEEEIVQETNIEEGGEVIDQSSSSLTVEQSHVSKEKKVFISPQVEHALDILNNVITMVRGGGFSIQTWSGLGSTNQEQVNLDTVAAEVGSTPQDGKDGAVCLEAPKADHKDKALDRAENGSHFLSFRPNTPESSVKEVNHNRVAPASPKENSLVLERPQEDAWKSSQVGTMAESVQAPVLGNMNKDYNEVTVKVNGIHEVNVNGGEKLRQKKKHRVCCLHFVSGQ